VLVIFVSNQVALLVILIIVTALNFPCRTSIKSPILAQFVSIVQNHLGRT